MGFTELNDLDKIAILFSQDQENYKNLIKQGRIDDVMAITDLMASFVTMQEQEGEI